MFPKHESGRDACIFVSANQTNHTIYGSRSSDLRRCFSFPPVYFFLFFSHAYLVKLFREFDFGTRINV